MRLRTPSVDSPFAVTAFLGGIVVCLFVVLGLRESLEDLGFESKSSV